MAIWQVCFFIIPRENTKYNLELDELISWKSVSFFEPYVDFLEKSESWSKNIFQYGQIDSTCIMYIMESGYIEEINCRLDIRSLTPILLKNILDFISKINGVIYYRGKVYDPNMEDVIGLIIDSDANKFCKNPRKFFDDLI